MKTQISIMGMHCRSCELLIEDELKKIPGIRDVKADFRKKTVEYHSKSAIDESKIEILLNKIGYMIGAESKPWLSLNGKDYIDLIVAVVAILLLAFIIKKLNFHIDSSNLAQPSSLMVILFIGLTAGISTCMALVGGFVLGISSRFAEIHPDASPIQKFRPHIFFNLGRILSFLVLGGVVGQIGKVFHISNSIMGFLVILVGLVMLVLGLQLIEIFPKISSAYFVLPSSISKIFKVTERNKKEYSHLNSAILGALTFFLPCAFTQAMQLFALSTGNFVSGALIMGIFALGTAPGLLGIGGITSIIQGKFAKKFFKFAGILVIFLALFNVRNGWNLTGWHGISFNFSSEQAADKEIKDANVTLENGVQIVKMTQSEKGYFPNSFKIKKGLPVKWIITSTSSYTCASALVSRQLNIDVFLKSGENIFAFTPDKTGTINFSCSMGMYRGKFEVTE